MRFWALCLILLIPFVAFGATKQPDRINSWNGHAEFKMCASQTATGICDSNADGTGDDLVVGATGFSTITVYPKGPDTTATTFSCTLYGNRTGDPADGGDAISAAITEATPNNTPLSVSLNFSYIWWNCSAITGGGTVTIHAVLGS